MLSLQGIMPMIFMQWLAAIINPLFLLVMVLVAWQYRRIAKSRNQFFQLEEKGRLPGWGWLGEALLATVYGVLGGLLGSLIMVTVGVTLTGSGLNYIWPLAVFLMLIDMRFLCFAYAGGILALSNLLLGWPVISVPQVLALVAILHLVESLLIYFGGHLGAVPAYIKLKDERIVGGFVLQRFWPIPVVSLIVLGYTVVPQGGLSMPDWWPLLKPTLAGNTDNLIYALLPVVAGLGYGDLVVSRSPRQKAAFSATGLAIYSVILLILAVMAENWYWVGVVAALFSPLGHEGLIYLGKKVELVGEPRYVPVLQGLKVLDVMPGTVAWKAGLRAGDLVKTVNGLPVVNRQQWRNYLQGAEQVVLEYISSQTGQHREKKVVLAAEIFFGLLPVPDEDETTYMGLGTGGLFTHLWQKWRSK